MKTKLVLLLSFCLLKITVNSQVLGNQRGMYVNQFVDLWHNNAPGHANNSINTNSSILSNITAENKLLTYCMENHITYIILYDMASVFDGTSQQTNKINELKRFICKAKRDYCIKYVGTSITLDTYDDVKNGFGLKIAQTPPYVFDSIFHGTDLYDSLSFVEDTITNEDSRFRMAELSKLSLRIAFMNGLNSSTAWTVCSDEQADILVTEYEFWNTLPYDDPFSSNDYIGLIDAIDNIRNTHNGISTNNKLFVETYIGRLTSNTPSGISACVIAEFIDGVDNAGNHRVDRILADYYSNNPVGVYSSTNNFYQRRFLNFCEASTGSCAAALSTQDNTDYHPLFSAQAPNVGAGVNSNFLGSWFPGASDRNIFTVERHFYDDYFTDGSNNNLGTPNGNDVQPGAAQWLAQAYMVNPLNHPIIFLASQAPCPSTGNQNVTLTYQGPIENADAYYAGTNYHYVVRNSLNVLMSPNTGSDIGIVNFTSGTTGVNDLVYSLPPGNYEASLTLTYGTGCYYTYIENFVVAEEFNIHALNHPGNLTGPINLCSNNHVILQANWQSNSLSGDVYSWTQNGVAIAGANTFEYSASQDGDYVCTIISSTCGTNVSNVIHVSLISNPPRFIVANCSGGCITLSVQPQISGDTYIWQDLSTAATFPSAGSFPTTICNDNYPTYTVTVSNGACSQTIWKDVSHLIGGTSSTASTLTASPSSTVCPGTSVQLTTNASTGTSFLWSTGEVSLPTATLSSINVINPGDYFVITHVTPSGCEAISTPIHVANYSPELVLSAPLTSVCNSGDPVTLSVAGGTSTTAYTWSTGVIGTGSTYATLTVSPTNTTTYSVTGIDSHGCSNTSSVTVNVPLMDGCYSISQSVVPPKTYAGHPVTFSIEVCNNTGVPRIVNLKDDLLNLTQFVYLSGTLPAGTLTTSGATITLPASPQCTTYTATGYFIKTHDCSDGNISHASHTNTATLTPPTPASVLTSSECATILKDCPMRIVGTSSSCNVGDDVTIALDIHNTIMNVDYIDVMIVYPSFLIPPNSTQLVAALSYPYSVSATPTIGMPSPAGIVMNGVSYNQVSLNISFASPYISSNIYDWFYRIKFKIGAGRPAGQNQFFVSVDGNNTTLSLSSSSSNFVQWTQASDIFLLNCSGNTNIFDARFSVSTPTCDKPGEFTFTPLSTGSSTAIHIWELGDSRRTPIRGEQIVTWDYLANYTDNTLVTQSRANGNYTFKVKHIIIDGGNFSIDSTTVTVIGKLDATVTKTDNTCHGANTGAASVTASFGTSPYTYSWSNGVITQSVSGLIAGSYSVTVTDHERCDKIVNFTITEPSSSSLPSCVTVTPNNTSCITASTLNWTSATGCVAGYKVFLGKDGGGSTPPMSIWNGNDVGNTTSCTLPILEPGTTYYYQVTPYDYNLTDKTGCTIGSFTSGSSVEFTPSLSTPYLETFESAVVPALPCGITMSDENYPVDGFSWKTGNTNSCGSSGSKHMVIHKNTNNSTAKDDWFYSAPLHLNAGEVYRVELKHKIESAQTETIQIFMSSSNDAATMLSTSAIGIINNSNNTCKTDSSDTFIPTSTGTYFVGIYANSGANKGDIYIDDLKVKLIKSVHLTTASCGDSLYTCDTLFCTTYTGSTSYKFKFENTAHSIFKEYVVTTTSPRVYQFLGTDPLDMGYTYTVSIAASTGGGNWSPYGSSCDVYLRPVPTTGLTGASCGSTLTDLSQLIYTNTTGICLVADFKYEFTNQSTGSVIETQRNTATTSFLLTYIASPYVRYSTTYSVRVKLKIGNSWGNYGSSCTVTTPASPLTKLTSTYCNYSLPTFATPVSCVTVLGAQDYRYKITGPSGYNRVWNRNSSLTNWYFTWTNASSPYMEASKTYWVKVASSAGGVWSAYGDSCSILTPASLSRLADTSALQEWFQPVIDFFDEELAMNIFPNPNNSRNQFSIQFKGIHNNHESIILNIFNTLGEKVYRSTIKTNEEREFIIQPQVDLSPGVYFVESIVGEKILRTKFVVQ